jgi:hypothetical protein
MGRDAERYAGDLGQKRSGIFSSGGLDTQITDLPVGQRLYRNGPGRDSFRHIESAARMIQNGASGGM